MIELDPTRNKEDITMSFMDKISDYAERLEAAQAKYGSYRKVRPAELQDFHEPVNEAQKQIAKKDSTDSVKFICVVGLFFVLFGVIGIFAGGRSSVVPSIAIIVVGLIIAGIGIVMVAGKTQVMEGGKAAWKQTHRTGSRRHRGSTSYRVSVYFDHPEKVVVPLVQTTKSDYERIEEGTPILIIKKGSIYSARIDE